MTNFRYTPFKKDQRGNILVFVLIFLTVVIGIAAMVIDIGMVFAVRADAQTAADAAALAGARKIIGMNSGETEAKINALLLARRNGFDNGQDGTTVSPTKDPTVLNWYRVDISQEVPSHFSKLFGIPSYTINVTATASFLSAIPMDISGGGEYGKNGVMTLSHFGPLAPHSYGDDISVKYMNDGRTNPDYDGLGFNYKVTVPSSYSYDQCMLEIFDPETWNIGNANNAGSTSVDEIRSPTSSCPETNHAPWYNYTVTRYQLFAPDDTPNNHQDDVLVAEATVTPDMRDGDMAWIVLENDKYGDAGASGEQEFFMWDVDKFGTGNYRLNVTTTSGSSENGYNLRAGPPPDEADWDWSGGRPDPVEVLETNDDFFDKTNGTNIEGAGMLGINFNASGTVDIALGYIPYWENQVNVWVDKFDTDVGAQSVYYYWKGSGETVGTGVLTGNDQTVIDQLTFDGGTPGDVLMARYQAGLQDTSVWSMWWDGDPIDGTARLRLVR